MSKNWWAIENESALPSPTLLVYPDRVSQNLDRMIAWTGDPSRLRPHVKTHKLPQIIQLKLSKGLRKFKASTIAEVEMVAMAGGQDILLAMQPVGANFFRLIKLIQKFPAARISTIVDDSDHLDWMQSQATKAGVCVPLMVDLNVGMNRAGVSVGRRATALCNKLVDMSRPSNSPVAFVGLHAYDGHLLDVDGVKLTQQAEDAFAPVWQLADAVESLVGQENMAIVVSGTPTSPILSGATRSNVEVSAGTTVLWDWRQKQVTPNLDFLHAAVVLARVVSKPLTNRLCLDLGYKAIASESSPPRVRLLGLEDAEHVMHSEEHLVIETPRAVEYPIGATIYGIPYHVCPTVALHSHAWFVREGRAEGPHPVVARQRMLEV